MTKKTTNSSNLQGAHDPVQPGRGPYRRLSVVGRGHGKHRQWSVLNMKTSRTKRERQRERAKPEPFAIDADNIPKELTKLRRWVVWRWVWKKTKWDKPPCDPNTGSPVSATDKANWLTFRQAYRSYRNGDVDGIGIVLGLLGDGRILSGVDLDDVYDPTGDRVTADAALLIRKLSTYTEVSPSETGVKCFTFGSFPEGRRQYGNVEVYDGGRYFTVTGRRYKDSRDKVRRCPNALREVYYSVFGTNGALGHIKAKSPKQDIATAREALAALDQAMAEEHETWIQVGMALHSVSDSLLEDWDKWSRICEAKYNEGECERRWRSFGRRTGQIFTLRSLCHWAIENGHTFGGEPEADSGELSLRLVPYSQIEPEEITWLWENRIPRGKVTILSGDPGVGKSWMYCDLAATVSRGGTFPDGAKVDRGSVIILSAEDGIADTIRVRLDLQRARVRQIFHFELQDEDGAPAYFHLEDDLGVVERMCHQLPDLSLLILDPITAFLGSIDQNAVGDVRRVFAKLKPITENHNLAVVGISHFSKRDGRSAALMTIGSGAFVAAARYNWVLMRAPEVSDRRLFLWGKGNLGPEQTGLSFRITDDGLVWGEAVAVSADDMVRRSKVTELDRGIAFLTKILGGGPRPYPQIRQQSQLHSISTRTLKRAKQELGVISYKKDGHNKWWWKLEEGK